MSARARLRFGTGRQNKIMKNVMTRSRSSVGTRADVLRKPRYDVPMTVNCFIIVTFFTVHIIHLR